MAGVNFAAVKASITCAEFAARELKTHGKRAQCPFHGGTHFNLAFNRDGTCHCFRCNQTGDVIQLAAATWNVDQLTAARQLAGELGLDTGDAGGNWREQRERRQRERQEREQERQAAARAWAAACEQLRQLEQAAARFTVADAERAETWRTLRQLADARTKVDLMWCEGVR